MNMIRRGVPLSGIDFHSSQTSFGGITAEGGVNLFWTYVVWIIVVVALYPVCKWYDRHKLTYL